MTTPRVLLLLLATGASSAVVRRLISGCNDSRDVGVGDYDGDGFADLACPCKQLNKIIVAFGDGAGNFSRFRDVQLARGRTHPRSIAVGDLNGDGRDEFVVGFSSPGVSVFFDLQERRHVRTPEMINALRIADVDGDGRKDVVWIAQEANQIGFLVAPNWDAKYLAKTASLVAPLRPPKKLHSVLATDLDGDDSLDLLLLDNYIPPTVLKLLSLGGAANKAVDKAAAAKTLDDRYHDGARDACAADLDGDAFLDVVVAYKTSDQVTWYDLHDDDDGEPRRHVICEPKKCRFACSLVCEDFDGDSRIDVAVAQKNAAKVDIFFNTVDGENNATTTRRWRRVTVADDISAVSGLRPIFFRPREKSSLELPRTPDALAFVGRGATTSSRRRRRRRRRRLSDDDEAAVVVTGGSSTREEENTTRNTTTTTTLPGGVLIHHHHHWHSSHAGVLSNGTTDFAPPWSYDDSGAREVPGSFGVILL